MLQINIVKIYVECLLILIFSVYYNKQLGFAHMEKQCIGESSGQTRRPGSHCPLQQTASTQGENQTLTTILNQPVLSLYVITCNA